MGIAAVLIMLAGGVFWVRAAARVLGGRYECMPAWLALSATEAGFIVLIGAWMGQSPSDARLLTMTFDNSSAWFPGLVIALTFALAASSGVLAAESKKTDGRK